MNLSQVSAITGFVSSFLVVLVTLVRQKRFDKVDLPTFIGAFLAGYNIPGAIFLCIYVFNPDPPELLSQAKIAGMDKYFSFSGIALLFLSLFTIWSFIQTAHKQQLPKS